MRLLPMPWISLAILLAWPMLYGPSRIVAIGAVVLAWLLPFIAQGFVPRTSRASRPLAMLRLLFVVLVDIIKSNIVVARIVLGNVGAITPRFIEVPLESEHELVANLTASIITMTPGTVSAHVEPGRDGRAPFIVVHALDCEDPAGLVDDIKARYEAPLLEIFRCSRSR